jgi:hypothetical protein
MPVLCIVNTLFLRKLTKTRLSAKQNNISLHFGWHKSQKENIVAFASMAL